MRIRLGNVVQSPWSFTVSARQCQLHSSLFSIEATGYHFVPLPKGRFLLEKECLLISRRRIEIYIFIIPLAE